MQLMAKEVLQVSTDSTFGQRLRQLRQESGLTQTELAQAIESSQRAICSYEQDRTAPPLVLLPRIALALDVSLDSLMSSDNKPKDSKLSGRWQRRFQEISALPERKQRTIMQVIDMALKSES